MRVSGESAAHPRCFAAARSGEEALKDNLESSPRPPKLSLLGRDYQLPKSRPLRVAIGIILVFLGCLGFLPVLGFWMIPLGLLILSYEFHIVRRLRRRLVVRWERRKARRRAAAGGNSRRGSGTSGSRP